ncbi:MAG: nitroreductase family protein [Thermoplasmata archaeon]|nr:nitroreductase family protein [Thermoplasmata archaeon]
MENAVMECIKTRRSIRRYKGDEIPPDIIERIIDAGRYAPSAENRQPWRFIVVTDRQFISELSDVIKRNIDYILRRKRKFRKKYKELEEEDTLFFLNAVRNSSRDIIFYNAPAVIFVLTQPKAFNLESCAAAAQNMMLAAWSMGIGSCWIGFAKFLELDKEYMEKLGVPEGYEIAACISFGYPVKVPRKALPRKPNAGIIKWIGERED